MRSYIRSLGFAFEGLIHALQTERNFRLFVVLYVLSLIAAGVLGVTREDWIWMIFSGGTFLAIELFNTALEHFTDAFDTHSKSQDDIHFEAMKHTKDIAAASALACGAAWGVLVLLILWPYARAWF